MPKYQNRPIAVISEIHIRFQFCVSSQPPILSASQTQNAVNQTSGGVTIVKLNSTLTSTATSKPSQTAVALGSASAVQRNTPISTANSNATSTSLSDTNSIGLKPSTSQASGAPTGGHVVTIHTSNITTSGTNSSSKTNANGTSPLSQAQHTGYTRRAKFGDSRSTGRLHSAGNTHRSMTRLNITGIFENVFN